MFVLVVLLLLLIAAVLCQVYSLPLDVPRVDVPLMPAVATLKTPCVVYTRSVLPPALLAQARDQALQLPVIETQLGPHRRSGTVPAAALEGSCLAAIYRSPQMRSLVSEAMAAEVDIAPAQHPHSCSLLTYRSAGDHITHHYDTNWYVGSTYTALLTLVNERADGTCCSSTRTCYTREDGEVCLPTEVNSLLIMRGDKVRHRATPLREGETRVVLSMTFTTDRSQWGWQCVGRWIKDTSFGI